MKENAIAFISILAILLAACTKNTNYSQVLVQADSLLTLHSDSALYILQNISSDSLQTKADRAYYALLLTQAQDKNYIEQTDDSLIQIAVRYYDTHKNAIMQARAYYCWGNIYRDRNNYSQAINKYTIALSHIHGLSEDAKLKSSLYSNIGYLFYTQGMNAEADSIYHQAELLAKSQRDTVSLCYALSQRGMISLEQGDKHYPEAEQRMLQALSIGKTFSDSTILVPIYHSLSMLYNLIPQPKQALHYAYLNYFNSGDTLLCYRIFLLLGNAYFLNCQYDSASIFLQKILKAERYYDTKADACMRLSEIAQLKGDIETSALMENRRSIYLDSARINQQGHGILNVLISNERNSNNAISNYYSHIIYTISIILFIISIFCIVYFRKKNKRHKIEKKKWEEKLQVEITQVNLKEQELAEKKQENTVLQQEILQLGLKKQDCAEKEYKTSAIYLKVSQIAKDLVTIDTKENLSGEEWSQFIAITDIEWNGIITYLNEKYNLSVEEIQICCLYLAQVPVKHMGHFINIQSRSTIQTKSKVILLKMGIPEGILLKNALFSLAKHLKSSE